MKNKKSKTWEDMYGIEGAKLMRQKRKIQAVILKNKTYEEIYGEKRGKEKRKEQSIRQTGKKLNRIKPSYKKGKSDIKIYGVKKAKQIKNKAKISKIKSGFQWTEKKCLESYLNIPNIRKAEWNNYRKQKILPDRNTINRMFGDLENFINLSNKKFLKPKQRFGRGKGHNEIKILDFYANINNVDIDKNFYVGRLKPDGANHKSKQFVEVDENHKCQQVQDKIRENIIKEKTGYSFIRLDEKEWLGKMENQNNKTLEDF